MARTTVALLFSDIEGSTRLLQQLGPAYVETLFEHRRLLRSAFQAHAGAEQGTEGDSFFVLFSAASDAVAAALDAQRAIASYSWQSEPVKVRIGLHVGEVDRVADAVVGLAVHEAARIASAAHGGQILASVEVFTLAVPLPVGAGWRDLGAHQLKDISQPVGLFQLTHAELPIQFPPVRSQGSSSNNLPGQPTAFIGREREQEEVKRILESSRLVTVTGVGGAGKSRMALRVAAEQTPRFRDGVWFVDLAPVFDPMAVPAQIASSVGVADTATEDICQALRPRRMLLLIDNCEHLIEATADVVDAVLTACPGVSVLATSREPLGVAGEAVWRIPSLALDDAAALFASRAQAANSGFTLSETNRAAVMQVCQRLDAIPLALEPATGWVPVPSACQPKDHAPECRVGQQHGHMAATHGFSLGRQFPLDRQGALRYASCWALRSAQLLPDSSCTSWAILRSGSAVGRRRCWVERGAGWDGTDGSGRHVRVTSSLSARAARSATVRTGRVSPGRHSHAWSPDQKRRRGACWA